MTQDTGLDDKELLLEVWKHRGEAADSYTEMMWTGTQQFILLTTAIVSVEFVGLGTVFGLQSYQLQISILVTFLFLSLLIVVLSMLWQRIANRRFRRILELIAHIAKIEILLGLSEPLDDRMKSSGLFKDDTYLFERHMNSRLGKDRDSRTPYESEEEWIDEKIDAGPNTYTDLRWLHRVFAVMGLVLFIFNIILLFGFLVPLS